MAPKKDHDDQNSKIGDLFGSEDELDEEDGEEEEMDDEQNTTEEDVNEESWNEGEAPEYEDEEGEEGATEDSQALMADETRSPNNSLSSDQPIPSIEDDNEEGHRPKKDSPYLHGRNQLNTKVHSDSEDPQDDIEEEFDEEFEAELEAEMEDGVLIDEANLREYLKHKRSTAGVDKWPIEACRLYKLLYLRGLYPILPWKWEWPFIRIHPVPADLFTPKDSQDKALIKAEKSDFHGRCKPTRYHDGPLTNGQQPRKRFDDFSSSTFASAATVSVVFKTRSLL